MNERTRISWTDHTFNPWLGCTKVSAGCARCYAEKLVSGRMGLERWGPDAPRTRTKQPWRDAPKWHAEAAGERRRRRVFCGSLCDVFEDAAGLDAIRVDLWHLIEACTWLDWLCLTKRPENIRRMVPQAWLDRPLPNVWLGTSCENQETADRRVPALLEVPARVRFLSCEPLLGPIDFKGANGPMCSTREFAAALERARDDGYCTQAEGQAALDRHFADRGGGSCIDWVIVGGESGPDRRPMDLAWARSLREQCRAAGVPFFFKQVGAPRPGQGVDALGEVVQEFPQ